MKTKRTRTIFSFVKRHRQTLALGLAGTLLFQFLSLLPPLIFRYLVDEVVEPGQWDRLYLIVALYTATPILAHVLHFFNTLAIIRMGARFVADLRLSLYRAMLRLGMRYHAETPTGGMVTRLMGDTAAVHQLVSGQTLQLFGDILVFLFAVGVAFTIHATLAVLLLVVVSLYAGAYRFFSTRIRKAAHSARDINDVLVGRLQETTLGVRHVRIYNRELFERERYLSRTIEGLGHAYAGGVGTVGLSVTCNLIAGFGSTIIYGLAAHYVLNEAMTLGDLLALNTYVWMALNPALRLTSFAGQMAEIRVSLGRILDVLNETPDVRSPPGAPRLLCPRGRIEFRDVTFGYKPDEPLFRHFSLNIEPDTTVALVGHTGCGKTTLVSLLMRFWDVWEGGIFLDGTDIRTVSLSSLREVFGVVLQEPMLFEGTFAENMAYGRPSASRAEILEAARAVELDETAGRLPAGLDTVLGTYGVKLSTGEKQRVGIARALVRRPRILVLDEATSALDSESEAAVQRAVNRARQGRTAVVIAHRLSTIVNADRIVVLDRGSMVESGTHETLLRNDGGHYRRLYEQLCGHRTGTP